MQHSSVAPLACDNGDDGHVTVQYSGDDGHAVEMTM